MAAPVDKFERFVVDHWVRLAGLVFLFGLWWLATALENWSVAIVAIASFAGILGRWLWQRASSTHSRVNAGVLVTVGALLLVIGAFRMSNLRYMATESLPPGIYRVAELHSAPAVGSYACVDVRSPHAPELFHRAHTEGWLPAEWASLRPLVKLVAAGPGQLVTQLPDGTFAVDGEAIPLSAPIPETRIPPASTPRLLEGGEYWLTSTHPEGFDSRYFGPVSRAALNCAAAPVWLW